MISIFESTIKKILSDVGVEGEIVLTTPPNAEMGDRAFACFELAKKEGINPVEAAKKFLDKIEKNRAEHYELFQDIAPAGPYINFYFKTAALAKMVFEAMEKQGENYGSANVGRGKKIMIEYPSQNTHKEFHIGHLRNVCIGNTLVQLYKKCGYDVLPVNYINDFGAHVVKCLWGIQHLAWDEYQKIKNSTDQIAKQKWLGELYAKVSGYITEHKEVQGEIDELQKMLEAKDEKIWELFKETEEWSLAGFEKIHEELLTHHEHLFLESNIKEKGQQKVSELLKKNIATEGEKGAIIVDLSSFGLDIALVRKGTGAGLYMTSDLALAEEKFKNHDIEESITITGIEQNFYFKQLFKVLELSGFKNKMTHIGYGLVNLPEGKMSSRKGNVILYEDLRNEIYSQLLEESKVRHADWADEKLQETAITLTMAVLKFSMQKHEAQKNFVFDMKEAVSFEGFSAPYILYVVARINSLIKKSEITNHSFQGDVEVLQEKEEKKLLVLLAGYEEVVQKALEDYNPSVVTKYCFDMAQAFNEFYNKHQILGVADRIKNVRLQLCFAVKNVLKQALSQLSITSVDVM